MDTKKTRVTLRLDYVLHNYISINLGSMRVLRSFCSFNWACCHNFGDMIFVEVSIFVRVKVSG